MSSGLVDRIGRGEVEPPAEILNALPDPREDRAPPDPDRVAGMLLGIAIGDALGNTTEGQVPASRLAAHGEIRDYLPNWHAENRRVGFPSDDTQLAFWTLEHVLAHGGVVPECLAATFADGRRIFGMGHAMREFLRAYTTGAPWFEAARPSAGNGAVMRIAPVVVPHLTRPARGLWRDAILAGAVTHNDPSSIGACVATAGLVWDALAMTHAPDAGWWLERYAGLARPIEGDASLVPRHTELARRFRGPVWRLVLEEVAPALDAGLGVREACDRWYSGAFLLETMPSALFILARHAQDPNEALIRAVNDTKDSDTIGAIVGAVVGALHGRAAFSPRWVERLLGRTREDDDGRVGELIDRATESLVVATPIGVSGIP